jgi:hypothetical protein
MLEKSNKMLLLKIKSRFLPPAFFFFHLKCQVFLKEVLVQKHGLRI